MDKRILRQWLKSGYLDQGTFRKTERGACINVIRYADDFIITGATPDILMEEVKPLVETFLGRRGLRLSDEKTHLRSIEEGFDFLGFTVRKYDQKLLIKPSRDKVACFMERIRDYIQSNVSVQADRFLRGLNSRLRGFANFYRHVVSKKIFSEIDRKVYQLVRNPLYAEYFEQRRNRQWLRRKKDSRFLAVPAIERIV